MSTVNNAVNVRSPIGQSGSQIYAADTGTTNTFVVTLSPVPAALVAGLVVNFLAANTVSGTATLNVNGLGAKTIKKFFNSNLVAGDINAGQIVQVEYDGTNFQMLSQTASGSGTGSVTSVATAGLATGGTITTTGTVTVTAAVQSDMETATSTSVAVVPGVQQYHPGHPKAWVYCDSNGNRNANYNVSSVTKDSTGRLHTSFTVAFSSANYHICTTVYWNQAGSCVVDATVGTPIAGGTFYSLNITAGNAVADPNEYFFACHGDQ